ncbi:hypothetical protein MLD52_12340 [Puniceicoccaceae bacterium K14]|nr:hypothetical protein [Puniceicoccaceae bacterium K14]
MAENKKNASKTSTKKVTESKKPAASAGKNGKGDAPRNIFSDKFRGNFDSIDWSK